VPVASGHTASDQVETILYRLAASPGRRALLGMAPSDRTRFGQRLIRPLLGITREQTTAYCRQRELGWCEDESNLDPAYARARAVLEPAVGEVLVSAEQLQRRVAELGEEISRDYAGRSLLLVGVLKGAVFFLSDLMRYIEIPVEVDFMAVASYGSATDSSGVV